jgi:hypothetical protein
MKTYKIDLERCEVYVFSKADHKYHFVARLDNFKMPGQSKCHIRYFQHDGTTAE